MSSNRKLEGPNSVRTAEGPNAVRRLEYPIRGVHTLKKKKWEIFDIGTGELLETLKVGKGRFIFVVLDGEHVITDDYKVFSLEEKKNTQDIREMEKFFGTSSEEKRNFLTLPGPEKYEYVYQGESESAFEHLEAKKLVLYADGGKKIEVWSWGGQKLKKDYTHEFPYKIESIIVPPGSQEFEIGVCFSDSFLIFDISQKSVEVFLSSPHSKFFYLPTGNLGILRMSLESETISEVTLSKGRGRGPEKRQVAKYREAQRYLIFKSSQGLTTLLWHYSKPWEYVVAGQRSQIVQIDGQVLRETEGYLSGTDFFSSPFHNGDLAITSGSGKERKMEFVDIITGKKKQVLEVPHVMGFESEILPGDRYLVDAENDQVLIEFTGGKYQVVRRIPYIKLIPSSKKQKDSLKRDLDALFVEAGAGIPKDVTGVIFGFI